MLALLSALAYCRICSLGLPVSRTEYEAEDQKTSGVLIGPSRTLGTLAAEASGRRAIRLDNPKQQILLSLVRPARGFTIRYSVLASCGRRFPSSTAVIATPGFIANVRLTSHYGPDLLGKGCAGREAKHSWEETRVLLPREIGAGSTLSISMAAGGHVEPFAVDVVDAEQVRPPVGAPARSISVRNFGADPSGRRSSRLAFLRAIARARAQHQPVYLPPGRYHVDGPLIVDHVSVIGAGPWYSLLKGHHVRFYARRAGSSNVHLAQFAMESDVWKRRDRLPFAAIGGKFSNATFDHLYLQHAKVGIWLDGPARDIRIISVRIVDQAADGINLHRGIRRAWIENNYVRGTGDDGIASWSEEMSNEAIVIAGNTIVAPRLANGIAVYGGRNIRILANRVADVLTEGGGIHLGARFHSAPFSGRIAVSDNIVVRSGTLDPHWHFGVGAIWVYALERPIAASISMIGNRIEDPACEAVQLLGPYRIDGITVGRLQITGQVTSVFALQTGGSLKAERVSSSDPPFASAVEMPPNFTLTYGEANKGWTTVRADQPAPPTCEELRQK